MRFTERRIASRVEPRLPAIFRCETPSCRYGRSAGALPSMPDGPWLEGVVLNASAAGALIALTGPRSPEAGAEGEVRIVVTAPMQPFAPPRYLTARAVVRRVLCSMTGGRVRIAIEFRDHLRLVTEEKGGVWSGVGHPKHCHPSPG